MTKKELFQHIFRKNLTNHVLIFCAFGRKTQFVVNFEKILKFFAENSLEKLNFLFFILFENLLLKIELSEITPYSTTIFSVSWRRDFLPFPLTTPLLTGMYIIFGQFRRVPRNQAKMREGRAAADRIVTLGCSNFPIQQSNSNSNLFICISMARLQKNSYHFLYSLGVVGEFKTLRYWAQA